MKRAAVALAGCVAAVLLAAGCSPVQIETAARQAGIAAVATWVSVDNPTDAQKAAAKGVVPLIGEKASGVVSNTSYYATLMPTVSDYISTKVAAKDRLICQLAAGWLLTGIDTLFAMNPSWQEKQGVAVKVVVAFCNGASMGLGMAKDDPVMLAATRASAGRAMVLAVPQEK